MHIPEIHGMSWTGVASADIAQGAPVTGDAVSGATYRPADDGGPAEGVAYQEARPGDSFLLMVKGRVQVRASAGVVLSFEDEITPGPSGFRLAVPGDWVIGKAKSTTTGLDGEAFTAWVDAPGYIKGA